MAGGGEGQMETRQPRDRRCCATCRHVERQATRMPRFQCRRLGWETRPEWRFDCWVERPRTEKMRHA
jgi:hypothetical protein